MCRLDMEAGRLLCDDGRTLLWRPTAGKAQRDRRVKGWAATGQHVGSHMRQESRGKRSSCTQTKDAADNRRVALIAALAASELDREPTATA